MRFPPKHILSTESPRQLFVALVENTIGRHFTLFSFAQVGENEVETRGDEIDFFDIDEAGSVKADKPDTELE